MTPPNLPLFTATDSHYHHTAFSPQATTHIPQQPTFKKSKWTPEEDKQLIESVKKNGMTNWTLVADSVPGRTGKQCRERWTNQLCPELNKENWTSQEDEILIKQQRIHGNFWSKIARYLPGRSSNAVKNRWSWLSRHGIPAQLAAQMNFYQPNPAFFQQPRQRPPIPQIYQIQQTMPMDFQMNYVPGPSAAVGSDTNHIAFSEPTVLANSFGDMSTSSVPFTPLTPTENDQLNPLDQNQQQQQTLFDIPQNDDFTFNDVPDFLDDATDQQFWGDDGF